MWSFWNFRNQKSPVLVPRQTYHTLNSLITKFSVWIICSSCDDFSVSRKNMTSNFPNHLKVAGTASASSV